MNNDYTQVFYVFLLQIIFILKYFHYKYCIIILMIIGTKKSEDKESFEDVLGYKFKNDGFLIQV